MCPTLSSHICRPKLDYMMQHILSNRENIPTQDPTEPWLAVLAKAPAKERSPRPNRSGQARASEFHPEELGSDWGQSGPDRGREVLAGGSQAPIRASKPRPGGDWFQPGGVLPGREFVGASQRCPGPTLFIVN